MGLGIRLVNALAMFLVGEPVTPVTFPSAEWELREPRIEHDENSQSLVFAIRDSRYPRMRGRLTIKLTEWSPVVRWRTRLSGGGYVPRTPVYVSGDGYLRTPGSVGRILCRREQLEQVVAFLKQQRFGEGGDAEPLPVLVPRDPQRPRGGLGSEAIPED